MVSTKQSKEIGSGYQSAYNIKVIRRFGNECKELLFIYGRFGTSRHVCWRCGGSRICQGGGGSGADHGERAEREPKRGAEAEPTAGSRGRVGSGGEAESFLYIFTQKVAKS